MKNYIKGFLLVSLSGVLAWYGNEWAAGVYFREQWLFLIGVGSFLSGCMFLIHETVGKHFNP